jgi:GT2 family glycosyltransferase
METKSVFVIILNWNHKEDLLMTIDSFKKQTYEGIKIIVADNGSTDGSIEIIENDFPDISLILNNTNLGYAAGNNIAIQQALSQNPDFVLLANNDIFIDNINLISQIIEDITSNFSQGSCVYGIQERNYFYPEKNKTNGWIFFEDLQNKNKPFNIKRTRMNSVLPPDHRFVDFVSGSFIVFHAEVLRRCGIFDEAFYMYHEDAELCFRAWMNGIPTVVNTSLFYYHKVSQSSGIRSPMNLYYRIRNNYYFLLKHKKSIKYYWFFFIALTLNNTKDLIKLTISLLYKYNQNKEIWQAKIRAYHDVLFRKYFKQELLK